MRRRLLFAAGVIIAVLVAGGVSLATLRESDHGIHKRIVFTALEVTVAEDFLDVAPEATSEEDIGRGDAFFFHDELWNRAKTRQLGTLDGHCIFQVVTDQSAPAHCVATAFLRGGTVEIAGGINFAQEAESFFVAVTGGTERYENVVGEAKITSMPSNGDQEISLIRFELIPSFSENP